MNTYICKCGRRVQKSSSADNTGNRLKGYGPGHECYGCPYAMPWGGNEWNETTKRFVQDIKGYECRMSRTLSYDSLFIGSTKDKCTCSVFSLDFDFLEQISAWVKDTFSQGELTGGFSRDKIRPTDYSHNGRYCCTFVCAANKKGISAKAALLARFFNSDGNRKGMTPQQEMEKILADIKKAKEAAECLTAQNADAAVTAAESAAPNATAETPTTSESGEDASALPQEASPQGCESGPAVPAESFSAGEAVGGTSSPNLTLPANTKTPTAFDYAGLDTQTVDVLHMAESQYSKGKKMAETGLRWMVNAVSMAHDALCGGVVQQLDNSKHGNRGDDSFRAWCESISLSKSSAYNLLRVAERFGNIEVDGKSILDVQPATLLYEAAKPSAPADMVQKVTTCEITSSAEYRAVLKENQQLRTERDKARADQLSTAKDCNRLGLKVSQEKDRADKAEAREEEAWKMQSKAETRAQEAEKQLEGSRQVAEAAKLRADKLQEENAALKKQPIAAVIDEEEVDRRAGEKAYEIAADMTADYKARQEQDARDAYDSIILAGRSITSIVQSAKMQFRKLPDDQRETAINQFVHTLASAQGEVSKCL